MTRIDVRKIGPLHCLGAAVAAALAPAAHAQQVTYSPYIQLGDNGSFSESEQMVVAWQTNEAAPNTSAYQVEVWRQGGRKRVVAPRARVVDNYLAADPALPPIPQAYGAHSNYTAVLNGLECDTQYQYRVTGPGLPPGGFSASFHTRTRSGSFSFVVVGDEGFFPTVPNSSPPAIVDFEARIAHLINNTASLSFPGVPRLPAADLILNTGDNIYNVGSEDSYRDFFFPVYNSEEDSNEAGAPILRGTLFFPVAGNHDIGGNGATANLLADNAAPRFSGNQSGGSALAYFNNFYFPQNGPAGFDIQYRWNVSTRSPENFVFSYQGARYTSPAAIEALRASTRVDGGKGAVTQIDHQSNYSFDYGNAHFLFLDANPHLFDNNLPGGAPFNTAPPAFVTYPTALGQWVINDLDSSKQLWKVVVFHQPAFSSGDATLFNAQMRSVAKLLEDHGVNVVFNGHEHNYQRTLPIRATARTGAQPTTAAGSPAVYVDQKYDGVRHTVPDGVLYLVEGAGGNRDFDSGLAPPRGSGVALDQDDSATGTFVDSPGLTVPQGPSSWLDTNLTNLEMVNFVPNAGTGTKITAKFKSKVFSFGDVVVDRNKLTLYQITEPLQETSSATAAKPAPYGTDINGVPLHDPIPDTTLDATTGQIVTPPATGKSALLDAWSITKPELSHAVTARLSAPGTVRKGQQISYTVSVRNDSDYALNGTQVRLHLPMGTTFVGTTSDTVTVQGKDVVVTIGRLSAGASNSLSIPVKVDSGHANEHWDNGRHGHGLLLVRGEVSSSTAQPIDTNLVLTKVL